MKVPFSVTGPVSRFTFHVSRLTFHALRFNLCLALCAISVSAQDIVYDAATPPVPLEPSAPDSASATTPHPAPVEVPHAIAQPIALRVVGSNVKNPGGEYLGRIDNVVVDGESARTEYAMLVVNYPTNSNLYTPVPWGALNYVWDQSQSGGVPGALQVFLLNIDKSALERAPTLERSQWSAIRQPEFAQQLAAFYGATDASAVGAAGTTGGSVAGAGSGGPVVSAAPGGLVAGSAVSSDTSPFAAGYPFFVSPGFVVVDTNFVGTNIVINTNVIITNVADGIQTNVVINLTNFPPDVSSNIISGNIRPGTNSFAGTPGFLGGRFPPSGINSDTNALFTGGTNLVGGGPLPAGTNSFAGTPGFQQNRLPQRGVNTNVAAASALGPGPLPGASVPPGAAVPGGIPTPTGRSALPSAGPVLPGTPVPGGPVGQGGPLAPSSVAPPGTVAPQTPAPPASPMVPTMPGTARRPSVPSSAAPPGVIAPQTPPPPASPIIPTMPGTAQRPSIPSSAAPPGTVAPQVPVTPPAAVPPAPQ